jgi:hypothetical protein
MNKKRGSIEMFILSMTIMIMIIILATVFLLYTQINSCIYYIKSDLFYIAQNAYIAVNDEELAYSNYVIDNNLLEKKITYLLRKNYPNYNINVNKVDYDYLNKNILIDINLLVEPLVLNNIIGNINLNIKEKVKLKLMEVK